MCMKIVLLRASASQKFNSTLFYYPEKPLYYYTIPFYNTFNIPNFYFTIQHIKIIFLRNKIIYPKNQIKIKTQITSTTYCHHHHHHHHEEHTQTETHGHATTPRQPQKPQPQNPWPPPSTTTTPNSTTMNPQKKSIPKSNQTNSKFRIQKVTHKKKKIKSKFTQTQLQTDLAVANHAENPRTHRRKPPYHNVAYP